MIEDLLESIKYGLEVKREVEGLYCGDHFRDVQKAANMYDAIDWETVSLEEVQEILQCLAVVNDDDRLFVRVIAWTLSVGCYATLGNFAKARQYISFVLNAPVDPFTIERSTIEDCQSRCKAMKQEIFEMEHSQNQTMPMIEESRPEPSVNSFLEFDEQYKSVCEQFADILVDKLNLRYNDLVEDALLCYDFFASPQDISAIVKDIESVFKIRTPKSFYSLLSTAPLGEITHSLYRMLNQEIYAPAEPEATPAPKPAPALSSADEDEKEYYDLYVEYAKDGKISERDRRMLDKFRDRLGISPARAKEIEQSGFVSPDEAEYMELYREYSADGEISERDRRMLDKFRDRIGISASRAAELERS